MLFTLEDMLLGVLIAAVVLLVKSIPLILGRVSLGYLAYWYVQHTDLNTNLDGKLFEDDMEEDPFLPGRRLDTFRNIRNSLKKNTGLYDESIASSFILFLFYLGGYFSNEITFLIIMVIIASVALTALYHWLQKRLYAELNRCILKEIRIEIASK